MIIKHRRKAIIEGNIAKIPLGVGAKHGYAILDREYHWLDKYFWTSDKRGYALSKGANDLKYMHHFVAGKPAVGRVVDHLNRNKKDNRKSNLRHANRSDNALNSKISSKNKSGYRNIYWNDALDKWTVQIRRSGKLLYSASFLSIKEAIASRDFVLSKGVK